MTEYEFTVIIEKDEDGRYIAVCPALQGCYTEGTSINEVSKLMKDAIHLHVEDRIACEEPFYQEVDTMKIKISV